MEENQANQVNVSQSVENQNQPVSQPPKQSRYLPSRKIMSLLVLVVLLLVLGLSSFYVLNSRGSKSASLSPTPTVEPISTNTPTTSPTNNLTPTISKPPTVIPTSKAATPMPVSTKGTISVQFYKWDESAPMYATDQPITTSATIHVGSQTYSGNPNWSGSFNAGPYDVFADAPFEYGDFHAQNCIGSGCGSSNSNINMCGYHVELPAKGSIVIKCWYSK